MTIEEKLQHAELLLQQIQMQERQIQRLYDEATRETYWLHPGDVVVTYVKQRKGLTRKVVATPYCWLVERISSYAPRRFKRGDATVWVWRLDETGQVDRTPGVCLQHYQLDNIKRIGHQDDYATIEHVDLPPL